MVCPKLVLWNKEKNPLIIWVEYPRGKKLENRGRMACASKDTCDHIQEKMCPCSLMKFDCQNNRSKNSNDTIIINDTKSYNRVRF